MLSSAREGEERGDEERGEERRSGREKEVKRKETEVKGKKREGGERRRNGYRKGMTEEKRGGVGGQSRRGLCRQQYTFIIDLTGCVRD